MKGNDEVKNFLSKDMNKPKNDKGGNKFWQDENGLRHREDGPAIEYANGDKFWYQHDILHRDDGPAIEWANGTKYWYQHGKCHRQDGPAIEYANGTKYWYQHGKLHRDDGPAIELFNGTKEWRINNTRLNVSSQQEFERYMKLKAFW